MMNWHTGFSDFKYDVEAIIAEDDLVAVRTIFTGTHNGPFAFESRSLAPTGKKLGVPEMVLFPCGNKRQSESTIQTGKLLVNLDTRVVLVDDRPLHLTGKEYGILKLLSLRKGTTLTKEMFLSHLYGGMDEPELKIIDVFVCKLRKKLAQATGGEHYIETVWGRGYVLRDPAAMPAATIVVAPEDLGARDTRVAQRPPRNVSRAKPTGEAPKLDNRSVSSQNDQHVVEKSSAITGFVGAAPRELGLTLSRGESRMRFEDAVTNDGGPLHLPRPDPVHSYLPGVRRSRSVR